jgi:hypothetical protein
MTMRAATPAQVVYGRVLLMPTAMSGMKDKTMAAGTSQRRIRPGRALTRVMVYQPSAPAISPMMVRGM